MRSDLLLLQSILHPHGHRTPTRLLYALQHAKADKPRRRFTVTACRRKIRPWQDLPKRVIPTYHGRQYHSSTYPLVMLYLANHAKHGIDSQKTELFSLRWPAPPQNILLVKKEGAPIATEALKEFAA